MALTLDVDGDKLRYMGLMFGKAEPVPVRSRPRLRPLGRALRRAEEYAWRAGEWLEETAPARTIRLARLLERAADGLAPRTFRHTITPAPPLADAAKLSAKAIRFDESILHGDGLAAGFAGLRRMVGVPDECKPATADRTLELRRRAREGDLAAMEELEAMGAPGRAVPGPAVDWQAGTPSDDLAGRAAIVRKGTGWPEPRDKGGGYPPVGVAGEPPHEEELDVTVTRHPLHTTEEDLDL